MLTSENYLIAWIVYLSASLGALYAGRYLLNLWFEQRVSAVCYTLLAVLLLMPWTSHSDVSYLAPAWLVSSFQFLTGGLSEGARSGVPLLAACFVFPAFIWLYETHLLKRIDNKQS